MYGTESVLLKWLSKVTKQQLDSLEDIKNPKIFYELLKNIPQLSHIECVNENENNQTWHTYYINYKNIFHALENFYRETLKCSLPMGLPAVNLLQISKGQDKEGLNSLLTIIFIACMKSRLPAFITLIMQFEEKQQQELMNLIQASNSNQISKQDPVTEKEKIENKIDELYFKIQSLAAENESLNMQLIAESEQKIKLKEQIKKLEQENKKIKRELDEKTIYIQQKQQQELEEESSNRVLSDSNEQVIKELKKELLEQEKKHLQERGHLRQEIETLKEKLIMAQDKIVQLESENLVGMTANRKVHHQNCISINEHKNVTQKLQLKLRDLEQKQTSLQRELAGAKYVYEELSRKCKKVEKEKQNIKTQYEKISQNKSQLMTRKDTEIIKIHILASLRDKIKEKLQTAKTQPQIS